MMPLEIVVAFDERRGIGKNNRLPWNIPQDLKHFRKLTCAPPGPNAVLMGRRTWASLPSQARPLPDRLNVVLSQQFSQSEFERQWPFDQTSMFFQPLVFSTQRLALEHLQQRPELKRVFVIGGAHIYSAVMALEACQVLHVTEVQGVWDCDVFFPKLPKDFSKTQEGQWQSSSVATWRYSRWERHSSSS